MQPEPLLAIVAQRAPQTSPQLVRDVLTLASGDDERLVENHFTRVRNLHKYFRDFTPRQIAEHLDLLGTLREDRPVFSSVHPAGAAGRFDVVVAGFDMVGVSACVTGCLAEMGLSIIEIDVVTYEPAAPGRPDHGSRSIMSLQVIQAAAGEDARQLQRTLQSRLQAAYWHLVRGELQAALDETDVKDELVGTLIDDRYRLERFLAQGGMGAVYLATQIDLDRQVVVKLLRPEFTQEEGFVDSLLREARLLAQARSHHVVGVYATGVFKDQCWMALEHLAGGDVGHWLKRNGVPQGDVAARWLHDSLAGLVYIHRDVGLIHCDLKPSNLLLDAGGNVKLSDLGLSQLHRSAPVAEDGKIRGTLWYMSPEQSQGQALDERSDLFSLGSAFYHILTGTPPFDASSAAEILARVGRGEHTPLGQLAPAAPPALVVMIERMMQVDPLRRYQDAVVALSDLESYLSRSRIVSSTQDPAAIKLPDTGSHAPPHASRTPASIHTIEMS